MHIAINKYSQSSVTLNRTERIKMKYIIIRDYVSNNRIGRQDYMEIIEAPSAKVALLTYVRYYDHIPGEWNTDYTVFQENSGCMVHAEEFKY